MLRPRESIVPSQTVAGDRALWSARIFTARPPVAVQLAFKGCTSRWERASQFSTRGVAPSIEKFQFGGPWNMPEASGKIVPRIVNEFTDASSAETAPDFLPAIGAVNEISVGAKSSAPREPLTLMGPIFTGDGSDAPVSFPPELANAPCSSCRGHPPRAASTPRD